MTSNRNRNQRNRKRRRSTGMTDGQIYICLIIIMVLMLIGSIINVHARESEPDVVVIVEHSAEMDVD